MIAREKAMSRVRVACAILMLGLLPQAVALAAAPANWRINPERTHIAFAIDAVGYPRTRGQFKQFSGRISVDFDHPDQQQRDIPCAIAVGGRRLARHSTTICARTRSSTPRIPRRSISSRNRSQKVDDRTVRVTGDLTLLGVTRPLSVDVAVQRETGAGGGRLVFLAKTSIDRLEFGMNSGFPLVSRDVELAISSEAVAFEREDRPARWSGWIISLHWAAGAVILALIAHGVGDDPRRPRLRHDVRPLPVAQIARASSRWR